MRDLPEAADRGSKPDSTCALMLTISSRAGTLRKTAERTAMNKTQKNNDDDTNEDKDEDEDAADGGGVDDDQEEDQDEDEEDCKDNA